MKKLLVSLLIALLPSVVMAQTVGQTKYPTALDSVTDPICPTQPCFNATDTEVIYDDYVDTLGGAVIAVETKLGITASTATTGKMLIGGASAGTSVWQEITGDITVTNGGVTAIGDDKVTEADLKAVDAASDEDILTYETTTGDFEWHSIANVMGAVTEGQLANDTVVEADLKCVDAAADEDFLTYESTTGDFEWHSAADKASAIGAALTEGQLADSIVVSADIKANTITNDDITLTLNMGGSTSLEIPNDTDLSGTGPTVDTAGQIGIDTDDEQFWAKVSDTTFIKLDGSSCANGQVLEMNASGVFVCATDDTAGAPTLNSVGNPTGASSWTLESGETVTFTSAVSGAANWVTIENSSATQAGQSWLLNLDHSAANEADTTADFLVCQDADTEVFKVESDGNTTVNGTLNVGGTATVTGDLTVTGDDIFMTTNTSGAVLVADGTNFNPVVMGGDATIGTTGTLAIAANAVTLATDTTGNFVATIADAGNSNITVANSGSENAAVTLNVVDVTCTDCLNATEIEDIYLLDGESDTMTGTLTCDGVTMGDDELVTIGGYTLQNDVTGGVDQFLLTTTNTAATATTDPMVQILVGTTPTADQQVFGVAKGTQSSNTDLLTLDEDGDMTIAGGLTQAAVDDAYIAIQALTAGESDWWIGINNDTVGDDNDPIEIRQSATAGTSVELELQPDGDLLSTGDITAKGGALTAGTDGQDGSLVIFSDETVSGADQSVTFQPHANMTEDSIYTLPAAKPGSTMVLQSDSSGNMSWAAAGSGDITDVGPGYASGAALTDGTVSTGSIMAVWEGTTADTSEFIINVPADPAGTDTQVTFIETDTSQSVALGPAAAAAIFAGPSGGNRTYTLPDASTTILTEAAAVTVSQGGTGAATFTANGALYGNGTGAMQVTAAHTTNGTLLIGDGSGVPTVATLTGTTNEVTVTNGAGSITLSLPNNAGTDISADLEEEVTEGSLADSTIVSADIKDATVAFADIDNTPTLAGDPLLAAGESYFGTTGIIFESATADGIELLLTVVDPTTPDKTITFPNETGTVITTVSAAGSLADGSIVAADLANDIAIDSTGTMTSGGFLPKAATVDLGSAAAEFDDAFFGDDAVISFGAAQETTITYAAGSDTLTLDDNLAVTTAITEGGNAVYNSGETPGGELGGTWASPTLDETGIALTSITIGALLGVDSIDATDAVDMDYGSADITDHTFITDGGADSITIGNNANLDFGITIDSDTNDFTLNFDEDNAELELTSVGDEDLIIDLDTATDQEVGISSSTGTTQINFNALNLVTTGTILGAVNVVVTTDGALSPTAAQMYGTMFVADHATATSDTDYTLPTAVPGMAACFYDNGGGTGGIIVDASASDEILLDGTGVGAADAIDSPGVAGDGANGDFICLLAIDATNWITLGKSGTWVDGGAD